MLCGVFRTKERKVIAAILGIVIIVGFIIISISSKDGRIDEQAVMAENYLNAGSYEQAVEAYQKALSMKDSDQVTLSMGLADAYVGLEDFDKALEVLRACYQKFSTVKLEKKIEEVTSAKMDYEFLQSISRADIYFSNKEYDKAISIYEEAKRIKRKDMASYQKIVLAYIEQGKYELARDEVLEGIEITKNDQLKELLVTVDNYLLKEDYDALVAQADEYTYQENYEDAIDKYKEAIDLLPTQSAAYKALAQIYIQKKEYNTAVTLLMNAVTLTSDEELQELLSTARALKEAEEERESVLSELSQAMGELQIDRILTIMDTNIFQEKITAETPVFYGTGEGDISKEEGLIIYNANQVYYGDIVNGVKKGIGIYFILMENTNGSGYYYYKGEWSNDLPNGSGSVTEVSKEVKKEDGTFTKKTVTDGIYYNALEDGTMKKSFYEDDSETGYLNYSAQNGIPLSKGTIKQVPSPTPATKSYSIGEVYQGKTGTGQEYMAEPNTIWGVDPFIRKKK